MLMRLHENIGRNSLRYWRGRRSKFQRLRGAVEERSLPSTTVGKTVNSIEAYLPGKHSIEAIANRSSLALLWKTPRRFRARRLSHQSIQCLHSCVPLFQDSADLSGSTLQLQVNRRDGIQIVRKSISEAKRRMNRQTHILRIDQAKDRALGIQSLRLKSGRIDEGHGVQSIAALLLSEFQRLCRFVWRLQPDGSDRFDRETEMTIAGDRNVQSKTLSCRDHVYRIPRQVIVDEFLRPDRLAFMKRHFRMASLGKALDIDGHIQPTERHVADNPLLQSTLSATQRSRTTKELRKDDPSISDRMHERVLYVFQFLSGIPGLGIFCEDIGLECQQCRWAFVAALGQ